MSTLVAEDSRSTGRRTDRAWRPEPEDVRIVALLAEGCTVDQAARRLGLSERTIRRRLRAAADEIGVDSTIEVIVHAVRIGLI